MPDLSTEDIELLRGFAMLFHQDFDLDEFSSADILEWYARGLETTRRMAFLSALDRLSQGVAEDANFERALVRLGAYWPPSRADTLAFLGWAATSEGEQALAAPGKYLEAPQIVQIELIYPRPPTAPGAH